LFPLLCLYWWWWWWLWWYVCVFALSLSKKIAINKVALRRKWLYGSDTLMKQNAEIQQIVISLELLL
jgi:hypothetical protein